MTKRELIDALENLRIADDDPVYVAHEGADVTVRVIDAVDFRFYHANNAYAANQLPFDAPCVITRAKRAVYRGRSVSDGLAAERREKMAAYHRQRKQRAEQANAPCRHPLATATPIAQGRYETKYECGQCNAHFTINDED